MDEDLDYCRDFRILPGLPQVYRILILCERVGSEILILKSFEQEWNIRCFVARRVEECVTVVEKSFNVEKDNNEDKKDKEDKEDKDICL